MSFELIILPNGLKVSLAPMEQVESVSIYAAVGAGPSYETNETAGLAHFLEHMLLEGTKKLPTSKDIAEFVENVGGKYGAFTSKDHVSYFVKMLPEKIDVGIDFIHQILFESLLTSESIEKEKNIVFEEIKKGKDNPEADVWDSYYEWA